MKSVWVITEDDIIDSVWMTEEQARVKLAKLIKEAEEYEDVFYYELEEHTVL